MITCCTTGEANNAEVLWLWWLLGTWKQHHQSSMQLVKAHKNRLHGYIRNLQLAFEDYSSPEPEEEQKTNKKNTIEFVLLRTETVANTDLNKKNFNSKRWVSRNHLFVLSVPLPPHPAWTRCPPHTWFLCRPTRSWKSPWRRWFWGRGSGLSPGSAAASLPSSDRHTALWRSPLRGGGRNSES